MKSIAKSFLTLTFLCFIVWLLKSGVLHLLTFEHLKTSQSELQLWTEHHFARAVLFYLLVYVATTAVSLPGATVLTLAGGAIFGLFVGTILVSFASTLGATICFMGSRFLFRDLVAKKFHAIYQTVQDGIQNEGGFYLFTLRLIPAVPYFVINLVFGLTRMRAIEFFIVSQLGMLPGTLAYVNAGTEIALIESPRGILSLRVILAFLILGILPWIAKLIVTNIKRQRVYRGYVKPSKFDYDIVVIGGGSAGLVSSYLTASLKGKVALIEKNRLGGDCLYSGCVPSKALIRSAHVAQLFRRGGEFGMQPMVPQIDFSKVLTRIHNIIAKIEPNDSIQRYTDLGVDCIQGTAVIADPFRIRVGERIITTRNIIIATGASPAVPDIPGLQDITFYTSDNLWQIAQAPKKILIMGGGPIGCELAQAFHRLGCEVILVEKSERLLLKEDSDVSALILKLFVDEGIQVLLKSEIAHFDKNAEGGQALLRSGGHIKFDTVIIALGRKPNIEGFGRENLALTLRTSDGTLQTDKYLRTRFPNILACGDVTGPFQFTHAASYQAGVAVLNALFAPFKSFRTDYSALPWCTFVDPEVARVGLNEREAEVHGIAVDVHTFPMDHLDRAICEGETLGMVKVLTARGSGKIVGATVVGARAGDIVAEFVLAVRKHMSLDDILNTVHAYPTFAEANRFVAGVWKKKSAPAGALKFLKSFHTWRRGGS